MLSEEVSEKLATGELAGKQPKNRLRASLEIGKRNPLLSLGSRNVWK